MAANAVLQIIIQAKDEASESLKRIGEEMKTQRKGFEDQARALRGVGTALTGIGAPIVAFAGLSVKSFVETGEALLKLSAQTGVAVEGLSALKFAAESNGVSLENVGTALGQMQRAVSGAAAGSRELQGAFQAVGVDIEALRKLGPEAQFEALAEAVSRVEDPADRAAAAVGLFGRGGLELLPIIKDGAAGLRAYRADAEGMGAVMSEDAAEAAAELGKRMFELKMTMGALAASVGEAVAPALKTLVDWVSGAVQGFNRWREENKTLADWVVKVAVAIGAVFAAVGPLLLILPTLIASVKAVGAAMSLLVAHPVILALVALGAGLVLLVTYWDEVKEAFRVGVNYLSGLVEDLVNAYLTPINLIIKAINQVGKLIGQHIDEVKLELPQWERAVEAVAEEHADLGVAVEETFDGVIGQYGRVGEALENFTDQTRAWTVVLRQYQEAGELGWNQSVEAVKAAADVYVSEYDRVAAAAEEARAREVKAADDAFAALTAMVESARAPVSNVDKSLDALFAAAMAGTLTDAFGNPIGPGHPLYELWFGPNGIFGHRITAPIPSFPGGPPVPTLGPAPISTVGPMGTSSGGFGASGGAPMTVVNFYGDVHRDDAERVAAASTAARRRGMST